MKITIVISILDSHEIVRRQIIHFKKMNLPDEVEIIFMDDGSEPPLEFPDHGLKNFTIVSTHNKGNWTQGLARNAGAELAEGEYLFMTDIDHIISKEAIEAGLCFDGDKMIFVRQFGILDEEGILKQDMPTLLYYGLNPARMRRRGLYAGFHGNTWLMKRDIFIGLGKYSIKRASMGTHLMGEDRALNRRYEYGVRKGWCKPEVSGPSIYFYPIGRFHITGDENPLGLFHNMYREKWGVDHYVRGTDTN